MKIDQDLRAAITAASKAQPEHSFDDVTKLLEVAVDDFLKVRPKLSKSVMKLLKLLVELDNRRDTIQDELHAYLSPVGLRVQRGKIGANFRLSLDDPNATAFVQAGGVLPPINRRKWSAASAISRLAAADPKDRDTILLEYGINWK